MTTLLGYDELRAWLRLAYGDDVSPGTLRYWASVEHWTPHGDRPRRWSLDQARATYLKYRGKPENGTDTMEGMCRYPTT